MKVGYSPASVQDNKITIRIRTDQKQKLEEYATQFHLSVSTILREAVTVWLNLNNKKEE
jgi:hypothetical protein